MNILVIGKFYIEGFALHIAETLSTLGHAVGRFEPGYRSDWIGGRIGHRLDQVRSFVHSASDSIPEIRARRMRALWQVVEQGPIDVVIVCHDFLWPAEVAELKRRTGAAVALWFPDHLANFGKGFFMNAPYDGLFFKDPYIVHVLAGIVASRVYYLPECFNPEQHCLPEGDVPGPEYSCDLTTAGNLHSWRVAFFKHLGDYDVKLWGNPAPLWMDAGVVKNMHQGRGVYNHDKARAFRGAKVVLNNLHYGETWGVNVRTFEAAGAGAFQMVDARPGLHQLFDDGKELVTFSNIEDLKRKLDYWLPREDERLDIAAAGCRRAHRDHTYALRLELMLQSLNGRAHGYNLPNLEQGYLS